MGSYCDSGGSCLTCFVEWTSLRSTSTFFRLPRGTLLVMGATTVVQVFKVWVRVVSLWCFLLHLLCGAGFPDREHSHCFKLPRGTLLMEATTVVQLAPASWVLTCTSVRTGQHAIPSLSLLKAVSL